MAGLHQVRVSLWMHLLTAFTVAMFLLGIAVMYHEKEMRHVEVSHVSIVSIRVEDPETTLDTIH